MEGPQRSTLARSRVAHTFKYTPSTTMEESFRNAASIYQSIRQARNITGPVLVQTAEDETAIKPKVEWDRANDQCWTGVGNKKKSMDSIDAIRALCMW